MQQPQVCQQQFFHCQLLSAATLTPPFPPFQEATAINDSLFELGKAISDLSQDPPPQFVNMRNSKLTLIMSDSLGGNAKTLMIVCVSPATFNVTETINSLEFAMRCKKYDSRLGISSEVGEVSQQL